MTTFERDIIYHGTEVFHLTIKRNLVNVLKENKSVTSNSFGNDSMPIFDKWLPKLGQDSFFVCLFLKTERFFCLHFLFLSALRTKIWRYKDASASQPDNTTDCQFETFPVF